MNSVSSTSKIAIIGGTGLTHLADFKITQQKVLKTPYGAPSAPFVIGEFAQQELIFLARHGNPHVLPPHKINYQANIWGLKQLGVTDIIAVAAVGGITAEMAPAHLVIPDQLIDYTHDRRHSFFESEDYPVTHIDFTFPYHPELRQQLIAAASLVEVQISRVGTYGCTQGPRLETIAEIKRMEQDGCDLVGMTGMPEAALAKELGIHYASLSVIANWAAGKTDGEITMLEIEQNLHLGMAKAMQLLRAFLMPNEG
ncbi:MAG: S-methyl-5'-thioinosine phosphorylase [Methylovulum sp.]|jgi:5'-deoxy-5'-methylthioadenosine phosphorylase|nr:S-methyl-5'-thioinosine phosphorylase [Methylovulum sp.]